MAKIDDLRHIAETYADSADETKEYRKRLKDSGVSSDTLERLLVIELTLRHFSAFYSEQAATVVASLTAARLEEVKEATDAGKEFLKTVDKVTRGVKLLRGMVGLAASGFSADVEGGLDSLDLILEALEEPDEDD